MTYPLSTPLEVVPVVFRATCEVPMNMCHTIYTSLYSSFTSYPDVSWECPLLTEENKHQALEKADA